MGCPTDVYLEGNLPFSIRTHDADTGALTDASAPPTYRVYENDTTTPILTGTMAKLDDANTTGLYAAVLACTAANGFEIDKGYVIAIDATVDGVTGGISYGFSIKDGSAIDLILAKLPTLGSGTIVNTYPLSADGASLTLKIGDSYLVADGRALAWTSSSWANDLLAVPLPTAIRFVANTTPALSTTATATGARAIRVELTHAQTEVLRSGRFRFDIEAAWADGRVETLVSMGTLTLISDLAP